jgi:hypothetical protein
MFFTGQNPADAEAGQAQVAGLVIEHEHSSQLHDTVQIGGCKVTEEYVLRIGSL